MRITEMPTAVQPVPLKRIRSLLASSRDTSNKYEAEVARARADELLQRYNLTEADLVEEVTEAAPLGTSIEGNQRVELARIIAYSRGVKVEGDREISFKGYPEAAKDARELFCALVGIVESHCEVPGIRPESDRFLWRICYWLGFVQVIQEQLDPEHASVPKEALPTILKNSTAPAAVQNAALAFESLRIRLRNDLDAEAAQMMAELFKENAHDDGATLAEQIPVPLYKGKR